MWPIDKTVAFCHSTAMSKLRKSVRTYRLLLERVDLSQPRSRPYREALDYLRNLYQEFGRAAVRAEMIR